MSDENEKSALVSATVTQAEATDVEVEIEEPIEAPRTGIPLWARFVVKYLPFLVKQCPFGNQHWAWARLCACGFDQPIISDDPEECFHGGVVDMKLEHELQPCAHCYPEHSANNHQWALTQEEEVLVHAWRAYRNEMLDHFGEKVPYKYEVSVDLNGMKTFLFSRSQGMALAGGRGIFADSKRGLKDPKPN